MVDQANTPLTGNELDFTKTYFGHDFSFGCAYPDHHEQPDVHRIVGWSTPRPAVGDVLIGRVHRPDGSHETGKLLVVELQAGQVGFPPEYFTAVVRDFEG